MAPPPPANLPLQERILALVKTLQFGWFAGHVVLLFSIFRYSLSYITFNWYSKMARFSYRLAFVSAALTYGIVVYKTFRARQKVGAKYPQGALSLLSDENVQYLILALVWLSSPQYSLALLPYGIYSIFHVATYTRANVIPTIQPAQPPAAGAAPNAKPAATPMAEAIGSFVKSYYDTSMSVVSYLELAIWARIFCAAIVFTRGSWILLVIYTAFIRARHSQSAHVQTSLSMIEARGDNLVGSQGMHPAGRQAWGAVKGGVRQFHGLTDLSKYGNGAAVPKKTS